MFLAYRALPEDIVGKLLFGLEVSAIGVIIVFAVLVLIQLLIGLFGLIFAEKKPKAKKKAAPAPAVASAPGAKTAPSAGNPEELVAAIAAATAMAEEELIVVLSAAVAAQEGCDPASSRYRIRSFRRIL